MTEKELTAKEKKRLKMVALGDTAQEIAEREYRAVHSINKCIESVKKSQVVETHLLNSKVKGLKEEEEAWHELDEYFDYLEKKEMKEIKNIPKPPKYEDEED